MSSVRIYPADRLTLPEEVSSVLQVKEGDFLEVSTVGNGVFLRPTRIFPHGSPEAEEELRRSERDFAEGRYHTFESVEDLAEYLGIPLEDIEPSRIGKSSVEKLIEEALLAAQGDTTAAAEALEEARRSLESREIQSEMQSAPARRSAR
jgi:bifunctional DNA-binding transcriptional regulator/antitoxin component of YhaV-PrlF toxin-antitoxin module